MEIINVILALLMGILYAWTGADKYDFGFFATTFTFLFSTVLGFIGANIGDMLRKAAMPDAIFTSGGMSSILKQQLFWFIGPQAIGALIGGACGTYIIQKVVNFFS